MNVGSIYRLAVDETQTMTTSHKAVLVSEPRFTYGLGCTIWCTDGTHIDGDRDDFPTHDEAFHHAIDVCGADPDNGLIAVGNGSPTGDGDRTIDRIEYFIEARS